MHICYIISVPYPPEEGIGTYVHSLATIMAEKGHQVTIITRGSWRQMETETSDGIKIIKAPFFPVYPFYISLHGMFVNKIFKTLESQIDLVHIHTPLTPVIKTMLPIITTVHTPMLTDSLFVKIRSVHSLLSKISARIVSYPLEKKLLQISDIVTTVSPTIANELYHYYHIKERIEVIGNGVDEKFFHPQQIQFKQTLKKILYVGRIDREKGVFDLVECARYLCRKREDIIFVMIGQGRDLNTLKRKIKKIGLQKRFVLPGKVEKDQILRFYQEATLFVLPSYHEGFPTVLLEAMSCGLPIVATDVRGIRDILSSGINSIMVPPRAPENLAEAILTIIEDEKLMKTIGENARKTIEEKYTWDTVSKDILRFYELVVGV